MVFKVVFRVRVGKAKKPIGHTRKRDVLIAQELIYAGYAGYA